MLMFRPLLRYADFRGRASRGEYLLFGLLQGVWYTLLLGLVTLAMGQGEPQQATPGVMIGMGLVFLSIAGLIVPNYAVLVRRLHDSGRGAVWLCLMIPSILSSLVTLGTIATAIGAVGAGAGREAFVVAVLTGLGAAGLLGLIGMIGQMILFVITLLPGTQGPNRFGPDPRQPGGMDAPSGAGGSGYDEDRLEALFAQARREQGLDVAQPASAGAYRPVFDFSPGSTGPMMRPLDREAGPPSPTPAQSSSPSPSPSPTQGWTNAGWAADAPARPFGRRGA